MRRILRNWLWLPFFPLWLCGCMAYWFAFEKLHPELSVAHRRL